MIDTDLWSYPSTVKTYAFCFNIPWYIGRTLLWVGNLSMEPTRIVIGPPQPALPCLEPNCIRRFYNRSGRLNHIRSHHPHFQQVNTPIPSNNYYNNADELPVDGADSEYQLSDASGGNQSQAHSNAVPSINGEFLLLLLMIFHLSLYLYLLLRWWQSIARALDGWIWWLGSGSWPWACRIKYQ